MMSTNLFAALSKGSQGRQENFCTDALAWILECDPAAHGAFFHAVAQGLKRESPSLRETVDLLAQRDVLEVQTRSTIRVGDPPTQQISKFPDLLIRDASSGACMLVEVKVWARATGRLESVKENDDATADAEDQKFVAQTEDYRRWLDEKCPGRGVLCALTAIDDPRLTKSCDVRLSWRDLASALRASTYRVTQEFIAYIEEEGLANKDLPLTTADMRAVANPGWEAIGILLDDVVELLAEVFSREGISVSLRGDWIHLVAGDAQKLTVWTRSVVFRHHETRLTVTPYLEISANRVIFPVGVLGDHLNRSRALHLLPEKSDAEVEEAFGEVYVTIDCDLASLDGSGTRQKASELAEIAAKQIRPLIVGALAVEGPRLAR